MNMSAQLLAKIEIDSCHYNYYYIHTMTARINLMFELTFDNPQVW